MQRAHLVAAIAVAAMLQSASAQQAPSPPPAPIGAAARDQANLNKSVSTMDQTFGAYGDAWEYTFYLCYTSQVNPGFCNGQATNIITFPSPQNGSASTTVSGSPGGGKITLGTNWCRSEMAGSPIYIPGAGLNGAGYIGRINECQGSQPSATAQVEPALDTVPSGTVTVAWGIMAINKGQGFVQSIDAGKSAFVGFAGASVGGANYTISAVNSPTSITLSGNVSFIQPNANDVLIVGHDDSVAVSNACNYVLNAGLRDLQVPVKHYTPSLSEACYGVKLHGNGAILGHDYGICTGCGTQETVQELVIPDNAPAPSAPERSVVAVRDLPQIRACGPNPVIVQAGDSLETLQPNQLTGLGTYPQAFQVAFNSQNNNPIRSIWPTWRNGAVGGAQYTNFDANPNGTNGDVITSTTQSWLSQIAAINPCGVTIGYTNNDGAGLDPGNLLDSYLKMTLPTSQGGLFSTQPDIIYITHHQQTRINTGFGGGNSLPTEGGDYAAGFICSWAKLVGRPCIDGEREGEKHVLGYDPGAMQLERRFDLPYNTNSLGLPAGPAIYPFGFAINFQSPSGQNGATFWNNFTGNGGASDPRGPFIAAQVGNSVGSADTLWLFYNTSTNKIGYECDPTPGLPGMGCLNGSGQFPLWPFGPRSNITVASSGGNTVVTSSAPIFNNCASGMTVTVPGAGPSEAPPGYFSYVAPLISTVATGGCNSTTQITLNGTPGNTYTAQPGFVFNGSPVTWSSVGDTTNCGSEPFQIEVAFDQARVWFCNQFNVVYAGPIWRARNRFQIKFFSGGNKPSLNVAADSNGGTLFQILKPVPNQITFTDAEMSGPSAGAPLNNLSYGGMEGGDGGNHNTHEFGSRVIAPLFAAQDLALGVSQGLYTNTPATGFSLTVPNGYGTVLLSPAGTLASGTITLPANYPPNQDLVITSTQAITALTLNANSGQSVNGAPTTLAGNTSVKFRLEGTAWYRLQ